MEQRITHIAGPNEVERIAGRLNVLIRRRLARMVAGARSHLFDLSAPDRSLLVTTPNGDGVPSSAQMRGIMHQVQDAVSAMLCGTVDCMREGSRLLPRLARGTGAFVASLIVEADEVSRAVLTFCFKDEQLDFVLTDALSLLRVRKSALQVAVKPHGVFRLST